MLALNSSFRFVAGGAALLCFAASVFASRISSFLRLFILSSFPCPQSCLVIWSRNVGSVVPPRRLPFPGRIWCLFAGSSPPSRFPRRYQVLCHDRWYERSDSLIELAVYRQRQLVYCYLVTTRLDYLPSPYFHGLGSPRPGGSRGSS